MDLAVSVLEDEHTIIGLEDDCGLGNKHDNMWIETEMWFKKYSAKHRLRRLMAAKNWTSLLIEIIMGLDVSDLENERDIIGLKADYCNIFYQGNHGFGCFCYKKTSTILLDYRMIMD